MDSYASIGVIKNPVQFDAIQLDSFWKRILEMTSVGIWNREDLKLLFMDILPEFMHKETGKYLEGRM
jgi:hypothetical protein